MARVPVLAVVFGVCAAIAPPAAGQTLLVGTPIVVEGIVVMLVEDDFLRGRATRRYFLDEAGAGKRYDLRLTPRQADIVQPGMRVRVVGQLVGGVLTVDQGEHGVVVLDAPAAISPDKGR